MVRVSSKGQVVLPKRLRDRTGIREGDYVFVQELDDGVLLLEKSAASSLATIAAELRDKARSQGFTREDLRQAIEKARRARQR
jgi:AbrB family looped-hinge helix DNA binding protein